MLWAILIFTCPSVLLAAYLLLAAWHERRTPPELQGDWWQRFEREFRAYAQSRGAR
jgi:hypothetical protein